MVVVAAVAVVMVLTALCLWLLAGVALLRMLSQLRRNKRVVKHLRENEAITEEVPGHRLPTRTHTHSPSQTIVACALRGARRGQCTGRIEVTDLSRG